MNPQKESKLVQYWADNHLVVSGNQYQLIDNETQKIIFKCTAIVSQINNFPIELVKLCTNGKVFPHFFHNTNHFAGILHISIKSMHNRVM